MPSENLGNAYALCSGLYVALQHCFRPVRLLAIHIGASKKNTEPIDAPCCAEMLHINGTIVLEISVDLGGDVTCVQMVSGHPLIIGVAIDSVRRWKFQPYSSQGTKKSFCGQVALRFRANEHGVKFKIL